MGDIIFTERELEQTKKKTGVYSKLNKPNQPNMLNEGQLKESVIKFVEGAFKEYVRKHKGMTKADEDKFWNQFRPILMRHL